MWSWNLHKFKNMYKRIKLNRIIYKLPHLYIKT